MVQHEFPVFLLEEVVAEGVADFLGLGRVMERLLLLAKNACHLSGNAGIEVKVSGVGDIVLAGLVLLITREAPICKSKCKNIICGHRIAEVEVTLDGGVDRFQNPSVSAVEVHRVGNDRRDAVPGRTAAPVESPSGGGNDAGELSCGTLGADDVLHPARICGSTVKVEEQLLGG